MMKGSKTGMNAKVKNVGAGRGFSKGKRPGSWSDKEIEQGYKRIGGAKYTGPMNKKTS